MIFAPAHTCLKLASKNHTDKKKEEKNTTYCHQADVAKRHFGVELTGSPSASMCLAVVCSKGQGVGLSEWLLFLEPVHSFCEFFSSVSIRVGVEDGIPGGHHGGAGDEALLQA